MEFRFYSLESVERVIVFMNNKFWENKSVLITGFEGFLGSNFTKTLLTTKAKIIGLDIKTGRKETIFCPDDYKKMAVYEGNAADYKLVKKILRKHSIKVIFHLAAEAIVSRSHDNPRKAFESNIAGTWEVLEASRQQGNIKAIVVASSDKAYGAYKKLPYLEDTPLTANHPYDVSKSCADLIAYTYAHTYELPVAITRCGNIFGPGDFNFSRIIPDAIRCALNKKTLLIRSDGKFTRDYVFVDDIVNGYIILAEKLQKLKLAGEAFNFSNENPITVIKLLSNLYKIINKKPDYKILNHAKYEIKHQYLCAAKARKVLGWKPYYNLNGGLKNTVNWYESYFCDKKY